MKYKLLLLTLLLLDCGCAQVSPANQIGSPPNCIEISVPDEAKASFSPNFDAAKGLTYKCYDSEESFTLFTGYLATQVGKLGYTYDSGARLRQADTGTDLGDYENSYTKGGSPYIIGAVDLTVLRSRGESFSGTGEFLLIIGQLKPGFSNPKVHESADSPDNVVN